MARACDAIVVGAGPAGLAAAACMRVRGLNPVILEKSDSVGSVWRRHYDRLHLHTDRGHSGLPGLPMPSSYGRYPSRAQVVEYLERYAAEFDLKPVFNTAVSAVRRDGRLWRAEAGDKTTGRPLSSLQPDSPTFPYSPTWPGAETFGGPILHSSRYRNPAPFAGKRVLVVGFGNSGGEIALDLAEAGIDVTLSVRGPVRILPRELLGTADPDLGDRAAAPPSARRRLPQRASHPPRRRLDRETRDDERRQGAAPNDRRGRPRAASRHRHASRKSGRDGSRFAAISRASSRRPASCLSGLRRSTSTQSFSRPASARTFARCCRTPGPS